MILNIKNSSSGRIQENLLKTYFKRRISDRNENEYKVWFFLSSFFEDLFRYSLKKNFNPF